MKRLTKVVCEATLVVVLVLIIIQTLNFGVIASYQGSALPSSVPQIDNGYLYLGAETMLVLFLMFLISVSPSDRTGNK